jgi:hypothetical protein
VLDLTRRKAFEIRGEEPPAMKPPVAPRLLPISDAAAISWQGSAGARDYVVERAGAETGPWEAVGDGVDDAAVQYRPLYRDDSAEPGRAYFYRVIARNDAGPSPPSNIVGPVEVKHRTLVDECADVTQIAMTAGDVKPTTGEDRRRREDVHRLALGAGGSVGYELTQPIASWRAIVYRDGKSPRLAAEYSADGEQWSPAAIQQRISAPGGGDYNYLEESIIASDDAPPSGARFMRLAAEGDDAAPPLELSRVEIRYGQ